MEMRGADGGPWSQICALPAVWVGLLYDEQALTDAEALVVRREGRGVSSSVGVIFFFFNAWFVYFYFSSPPHFTAPSPSFTHVLSCLVCEIADYW